MTLETLSSSLGDLVAVAWAFLAGFPAWFAVVLWPVMQLVMVVVFGSILALAGIGWIAESAQKHTARVKARAEADNKEAMECSQYHC